MAEWFHLLGHGWSVDKARKILSEKPREMAYVQLVDVVPMFNAVSIDRLYAEALVLEGADPVIVAWMPLRNSPGTYMVIDGWHRLWKAHQEGMTQFPCYMLTKKESSMCAA